MPLEIRELYIKVNVGDAAQAPAERAAAAPGKAGGSSGDSSTLVAQCVDEVMRILRAKKER
jgi:hypothetical protein